MPATASVQVRTLFAPFDQTTDEYLKFVDSAKQSIYIIIYGMHLPSLTQLLLSKHQAGVKVNLILDHSQEQGKAEQQEVQKLVDAGIPLLVGTSPMHGQILHTKATIVDAHAVESGSWNYSLSAALQSNTLTFVDDVEYARAYLDHWHKIHGFVALHDMIYQPKGAIEAEDVPAAELPPEDASASAPSAVTATPDAADPTPPTPKRARKRRAPRTPKVAA